MFEKDEDYRKARKESKDRITKVIKVWSAEEETIHDEGFQKGAEFGYNKAKEEMQAQDYSLFDFVMQYENGKFKCKYKSGKEFESVDGETWKEIVLPELKESE